MINETEHPPISVDERYLKVLKEKKRIFLIGKETTEGNYFKGTFKSHIEHVDVQLSKPAAMKSGRHIYVNRNDIGDKFRVVLQEIRLRKDGSTVVQYTYPGFKRHAHEMPNH